MIRIGVPVEWHAAGIYTRVMFDKFSREVYTAGAFVVAQVGAPGDYHVSSADGMESDGGKATQNLVRVGEAGTKYSCDCGVFDHIGMPCRHMVKVRDGEVSGPTTQAGLSKHYFHLRGSAGS